MLSHWHLYHPSGSAHICLADLPVTDFRLKYASRAAHELRLVLEASSSVFQATDLWEHFERGKSLGLTYDEWIPIATPESGFFNQTMFYGRLETTETIVSGTSRKVVLLFKGGWHYLTLGIYRPDRLSTTTTVATIGGNTHNANWWAGKILLAAHLAPSCTDGLFVSDNSLIDPVVSSLYLPAITVRDVTYAQALESILDFWPDVVSYTHVHGGDGTAAVKPELRLVVPSRGITVSDILSRDGNGGSLVSQNIVLGPSYPVPGVRVFKENGESTKIGAPDGCGGLMYTVAPSIESYIDFSSLPYFIYNQTRTAAPEGSLELVGERPPGLSYLANSGCSNLLQLGIGEFSANIQSVEFDIAQGRTTINFGHPPSVSLDNLVSLLRANYFGALKRASSR